jgi:hypothetical protein
MVWLGCGCITLPAFYRRHGFMEGNFLRGRSRRELSQSRRARSAETGERSLPFAPHALCHVGTGGNTYLPRVEEHDIRERIRQVVRTSPAQIRRLGNGITTKGTSIGARHSSIFLGRNNLNKCYARTVRYSPSATGSKQ